LTALDPLTGPDPSTLSIASLTERLAMERALREEEFKALRAALQAVKDMINAQAVNDRRALELQASVYEQRLEVLNHAHAAAVEAQAKTVPREMFDAYIKEQSVARQAAAVSISDRITTSLDAINARVDELDNWRSGLEGRLIGISAVIGIVVIIINIAIRIL
jgi:hypothetical protein